MKVAVVGVGIMGSGIAQMAAMSGYDVAAHYRAEAQNERAKTGVDRSLARFVKSGKLDQVPFGSCEMHGAVGRCSCATQ